MRAARALWRPEQHAFHAWWLHLGRTFHASARARAPLLQCSYLHLSRISLANFPVFFA